MDSEIEMPQDLPELGELKTGEIRIRHRGYDMCMDCFAPLTQENHFTLGGLNYCLSCAASRS